MRRVGRDARRTFALAVAAVLLGLAFGCSDDPNKGVKCMYGTTPSLGGGCVTAKLAIKIDGDTSDWSSPILFRASQCTTCEDRSVVEAEVARASDALFFHLITRAPPITDGSALYNLHFERGGLADPSYSVDIGFGPSSGWYYVNGASFGAHPPLDWAFTQDGLEVRLPLTSMPFAGDAAWISATYVKGAGGLFDEVKTGEVEFDKVCWDEKVSQNACVNK